MVVCGRSSVYPAACCKVNPISSKKSFTYCSFYVGTRRGSICFVVCLAEEWPSHFVVFFWWAFISVRL
jgi:hypothetical protein